MSNRTASQSEEFGDRGVRDALGQFAGVLEHHTGAAGRQVLARDPAAEHSDAGHAGPSTRLRVHTESPMNTARPDGTPARFNATSMMSGWGSAVST